MKKEESANRGIGLEFTVKFGLNPVVGGGQKTQVKRKGKADEEGGIGKIKTMEG